MTMAVFLGSLFLAILMAVPIAYALLICGVALMLYMNYFSAQIVSQNLILGVDNFLLLAIPFFVLAGELMNVGGISRRIIQVAMAFLGHVRGGLGYVAIFSALILASLSGSAIADSAALAALLVPMMRAGGYDEGRSVGLMAAGGIIAPVIPPSIALVVYGSIANVSIRSLFLAGIVPGLMMALALILCWRFLIRGEALPTLEPQSMAERLRTVGRGLPALFLPVLVIGGLRMGYFTPTEAAVIAVAYATLVGAFVYGELTGAKLKTALLNAATTSAAVLFLIGASGVSAWLITTANLPNMLIDFLSPLIDRPTLLMATVLGVVLVLGTVLDFSPLMLILMPLLLPLCKAAGIDLVYFGVVFTIAGALGMLTPPVGNVLNVVAGVAEVRMSKVVTGVLPFLISQIIVLIILVLLPQLVTGPVAYWSR
ncbi:MAG: L-dehydroascorbate transporter large permease subunit [Confluentimicrobium sp.]|nr:L-dehydroascorbate transporter large permease subunit [Actibacterium sp.]|tara:strand:- start:4840 stop:6120 length:1281 start_codon:yes stop_codon:yes gene_type:complete